MFTRPPFVVVASMLGLTVFIIYAVVSPLNEWWALPFPKAIAAYHLEGAHRGLDLSGCAYGPFDDWALLNHDSDAVASFRGVLERSDSAEGRLHALIGIRATSDSLYSRILDSVSRERPFDSVTVFPSYDSSTRVPLRYLLDSAGNDLLRVYRDSTPRPHC
jgi:hypothetical protein